MVLALEYEAHSPGTFKLVLSLHIYLIFVLSGQIQRWPLMALMSMVRNVNNAGMTDYDQEIRKSDYYTGRQTAKGNWRFQYAKGY